MRNDREKKVRFQTHVIFGLDTHIYINFKTILVHFLSFFSTSTQLLITSWCSREIGLKSATKFNATNFGKKFYIHEQLVNFQYEISRKQSFFLFDFIHCNWIELNLFNRIDHYWDKILSLWKPQIMNFWVVQTRLIDMMNDEDDPVKLWCGQWHHEFA